MRVQVMISLDISYPGPASNLISPMAPRRAHCPVRMRPPPDGSRPTVESQWGLDVTRSGPPSRDARAEAPRLRIFSLSFAFGGLR